MTLFRFSFFWLLGCLASSLGLRAQHIQWQSEFHVSDKFSFLQGDSTQLNYNLFISRSILYDSLKGTHSHQEYNERTYLTHFAEPQRVFHVVLAGQDLSQLTIFIRLIDTADRQHLVYDYGSVQRCGTSDVWILSIPPTPYLVKSVQLAAFIADKPLERIGLAGDQSGDQLWHELMDLGYEQVCSRAAYIAETQALSPRVNSFYR
ncbi:MAG: hypothetical protein HC842_00265, partial [Cytophagales bacterium]|nr:hypothetical protein [Cytophagales bacterium]